VLAAALNFGDHVCRREPLQTDVHEQWSSPAGAFLFLWQWESLLFQAEALSGIVLVYSVFRCCKALWALSFLCQAQSCKHNVVGERSYVPLKLGVKVFQQSVVTGSLVVLGKATFLQTVLFG